MSLSMIFLLFVCYSVIGWISEVIYCSILERRLVNRGFLHGPLCPVYGFGGLLILFLLNPFAENVAALFVMSVLLSSALEYVTSWGLEAIFSTKWWDYSALRFNVRGRICLRNSFMFGVMGVAAVKAIHPFALSFLSLVPEGALNTVAGSIAVVLCLDLALTLRTLVHLDEKLVALKEFMEGLRENLDVRVWFSETDLWGSLARLKALSSSDGSDALGRLAVRFEAMLDHTRGMIRIYRAFPTMRSRHHEHHIDIFRRLKDAVGKGGTEGQKKEPVGGFAGGYGFYKLFWIFLTASFAGVVVEMVWCVVTRGHLENRSGLLYGMINPVYGLGGLVMTLVFTRRQKSRDLRVFVDNVLIGGAFEYVFSLLQEFAFGSVSWDYSRTQFGINVRTNLFYALMWGFLGLLWVSEVYPAISRMIERIPVALGKALTIVLFTAMVADMSVTALAVRRWSDRQHGVAPVNRVDSFIDAKYGDSLMHEKYPNMKFVDQ